MGKAASLTMRERAAEALRAPDSGNIIPVPTHATGDGVDHSDFLREKPRDLKTVLGIFYTPAPLAEALADWAVRDRSHTILEPSFGGCGFLNATARRLLQLGNPKPWDQIYGCDKDGRAFKFLPPEQRGDGRTDQFLHGDFLQCNPADFSRSDFDVVLGNPPYVSRHTMTGTQIASAEAAIKDHGFKLSSRASLWAYFILHGLKFLKAGGRIAWVLPRSLTQSYYGRQLIEILQGRFSAVVVISLGQRMFMGVGTDEISDVLLATGFRSAPAAPGRVTHLHSESLPALLRILAAGHFDDTIANHAALQAIGSRSVALTTQQRQAMNFILSRPQATPLGELVRINIGLVTGASDFFVLRPSALKTHGLQPSNCGLVISKYRHTSGLEVTPEQLNALTETDERVLLLKCSQRRKSARVTKYLQTFAAEVRAKVATFGKRRPWHNLDDKQIPDAFLPCLVRGSPRLVLNTAKINCTNNVLRLWFHAAPSAVAKQKLALALASTPGQLAAEAFGRACGSGGLKIEPGDWLGIKLLLPRDAGLADVRAAFRDVDALLRADKVDEARQRADQFLRLTIPSLAQHAEEMHLLETALRKLQGNRK